MNCKKIENVLIFADFDNGFAKNLYKAINSIVDQETSIFLISRKKIDFLISKNSYFFDFDSFIFSNKRKILDTKDSLAIALNATKYGVELDFFEKLKKLVIFSGSDTLFNRRTNPKLTERFNSLLKNVDAIGFRSFFHLHEYLKFSDVPYLLLPYGFKNRKFDKFSLNNKTKLNIGIIPPENVNALPNYLKQLNNYIVNDEIVFNYKIFCKKEEKDKLKDLFIFEKLYVEFYERNECENILNDIEITINFQKNYDVEGVFDCFLQKHHPIFVQFNREYSDYENINSHVLIYETIEGLYKKIITLLKNEDKFKDLTQEGYENIIKKQNFESLKNKLYKRIKQIMENDLEKYYEDTDFCVDDNEDFVIFTHFTSIEAYCHSERPMRVRAIRDNFRKYKRCFVFMGEDVVLRRKKEFLKTLLRKKRALLAYEESLSSPSPIYSVQGQLRHEFRKMLKNHGINYTVFLRDMYQAYPQYEKIVSKDSAYGRFLTLRDEVMDMFMNITKMYTPSETFVEEMILRGLVPQEYKNKLDTLPPGINKMMMLFDSHHISGGGEKIKIVYTGGMGEFYDFRKFLEAFYICKDLPLELHLYIKKAELNKSRHIYGNLEENENIYIHEGSFTELAVNMDFDIGLSLFEDDSYRKMAIPVKVFDYLSLKLPVLAGNGTEAGKLVKKYDVGFNLDNNVVEIVKFLMQIVENREILKQKQQNITKFVLENLWEKRIEKVLKDCNAL
ncbi:hypothetical protein [Caminibacter pacificus]